MDRFYNKLVFFVCLSLQLPWKAHRITRELGPFHNTLFLRNLLNWPSKLEWYVKLDWKDSPGTNTLSYRVHSHVMKKIKCVHGPSIL